MKKDSKPLLPPVSFPSQGAKPQSFPLTWYVSSYQIREGLPESLQESLPTIEQLEAELEAVNVEVEEEL